MNFILLTLFITSFALLLDTIQGQSPVPPPSPESSTEIPVEEEHNRVGNMKYWTPECFKNCAKAYLRCLNKVVPTKRTNEYIVDMFRDKATNVQDEIKECSAKYHDIIHISDDEKRKAKLKELGDPTSHYDICVYTQCGAGGYYGSFSVSEVTWKTVKIVLNAAVDPAFQFYYD